MPLIPVRDGSGRRGFTPIAWLLASVWVGAWIWCLQADPHVVARLHEAVALDVVEWRRAVRVLLGRARGDVGDALFDVLVPLVGYKLVHGGAVHVLSNAVFFVLFAGRLEARSGSVRLLVFHEVAGALAALAQLAWWDPDRASSIGASGAVMAAVAAYLLLYGRSRIVMLIPVVVVPVFVEVPAVLVAAAWGVLQVRPVARLFEIGPAVPLAWHAYVGGAVAGLALTPALLGRVRGRARGRGGRR